MFSFLIKQTFNKLFQRTLNMARRHGIVVKADGSQPRGREFKPWQRILDGC